MWPMAFVSSRAASWRRHTRWSLVAVPMAVYLGLQATSWAQPSPTRLPALMVWAWERPTDLRTIDPSRAGVAYYAGTVRLGGNMVATRPRLQTLQVAKGAPLVAVVRIEIDPRPTPAYSRNQRQHVVEAILHLACRPHPPTGGVQIDFDAPVSARGFYADLLADLRRRLPQGTRLTITALASWCLGDPWIAALPVDEAIPMLFRMGPDAATIRHGLEGTRDFGPALCRESLGVSLDEPIPTLARGRRLFVFAPAGWSADAIHRTLTELTR
jgi:hypothetical protein